MKLSCKKLAERIKGDDSLANIAFVKSNKDKTIDEFATHIRKSCEAYGRKVFAYLYCGSLDDRKQFETWLYMQDIGYDRKYSPEGSNAEVSVSYFKAWHWDE